MRPAAYPLLLIAAVAAAYANAIGAAFQFDDWNVIVGDPRVQSVDAWWHALPGIRPLLKLSYALNHEAGGGTRGFHLWNVAIHAANVLLVFSLAGRLGRARGVEARSFPFVVAAVFALHPVQTEAVTYASGRSTSLSALFALASALAWTLGRESGRALWVHGLSPFLFACAVATKETAIVAPLALALLAAVDAKRPFRLHDLAGHGVALALLVAALLGSPTYRRLLDTSLETRGALENLRVQSRGVAYLAGQIVRWDRLNADPALPVAGGWFLPTLAILAVVGAGFLLLRRRPEWGFGILWFFLWLAPTNSLVARLDVANDRQLYLALAGPAWLLAWAIRGWRPRLRAWLAGGLIVALAIGTHVRNRVYADEVVFWEDVARKSPWNGRAFTNLGWAYALEGRIEEAEEAYRTALALDPGDYKAAINLRMLSEGEPPPASSATPPPAASRGLRPRSGRGEFPRRRGGRRSSVGSPRPPERKPHFGHRPTIPTIR